MHSKLLISSLLIAISCANSGYAQATSQSVLVLLDSLDIQQSHSLFFRQLLDRGYLLEFKQISDKSLRLKDWDRWLYDKLIIFASQAELGGALDVGHVVEFVDSGHDLLLAVNSGVSDELRELAQEMGVDLDAQGTMALDHFNFEAELGARDHAVIVAEAETDIKAVFPTPVKGPVLFHGIGMTLPEDSELGFLALWGSQTSYSLKPGSPVVDYVPSGYSLGLVALVQTRNNVRVAVAGSIDMFSDEYFNHIVMLRDGSSLGTSSNADFCSDIAKWTFHERGVLQAQNLQHRVVGGALQPERYRVGDDVEFMVDIYLCEEGACRPYKADDVQVELVMLDPYIRSNLSHNEQATFSTQVKVPDQYGVFKWVLQYHRQGYSYIDMSETVPIRPFRHDEYERFILQAYPYYTSVITLMAGFFITGLFFLYHK